MRARAALPFLAVIAGLASGCHVSHLLGEAPDPCRGVACSGHGTCVATGDRASCECEPEFVALGLECLPRGGPGCRSSDCPAGQLCALSSGACTPVTPADCRPVPPVDVLDVSGAFAPCDDQINDVCPDGLVCSNSELWLDLATGTYRPMGGACLPACDPCAPVCPRELECVLGGEGGGFCSPRPLAGLGQECHSRLQFCHSGLVCTAVEGCGVPCVPDDPDLWATPWSASLPYFASRDCGPDQLCWLQSTASGGAYGDRSLFTCVSGLRAAGMGELCQRSGPEVCLHPTTCRTTPSETMGTCSLDCAVTPCPDGLGCFRFEYGAAVVDRCVRDGAMPLGAWCVEDRNCAPWLRCRSVPGVTQLLCVP